MLGIGEILLVVSIVVLVIGIPYFPLLGKNLGKSFHTFKKALKGEEDPDVRDVTPPKKTPPEEKR